MGWLAYRLSGSIWILGLVGFCSQAAVFFLAPFAGILADRGGKKPLIGKLQYVMLAQAAVMSLLAWSGYIQAWHIVMLSLVLGVTSAFDAPLRQAMLADLVNDKEHLSNAIALNSLLVNIARVAGPALAAIVVKSFGEAACFALNALSFAAIIAALSRMRWTESPPLRKSGYWASFVEATGYGWNTPNIRDGLLLVAAVSWCISPYVTMMPVFVKDSLGGDVELLGHLMSAAGAGTIAGTLYLAGRRNNRGLTLVVAAGAAASGGAMCVFAWSSTAWIALCLMFAAGGGMTVAAAGTNTMVQSTTASHVRARIASFYITAFIGVAPFGTIATAAAAEAVGIRMALCINGGLCCTAALWYWRRNLSAGPHG